MRENKRELKVLQNEMVAALKARNKFRKDVISSLVGAVKKAAIDKNCRDNITEELVNAVLIKEQKTMQEMIDTCPATRPEVLAAYTAKKQIIDEFTPQVITDAAQIKTMVEAIGIDLTKKNRGAIMKVLKDNLVDMKIANQVVGGMLS